MRGGALFKGKEGRGDFRKNSFFNAKEGWDDFRNSFLKEHKIKQMNIIKTEIEGVLIIEPRLFRDARGYFFESFSEREFEEKVAPIL